MPLSAWRKWWRRSTPRSKKLNKKPPFRKCFLEILEDRTLLSNTYTVNLVTDNVINTGQQSGPTSGDLRWCIEQADLNPGSMIQFDPTVFPSSANTTIALSQGELQIAASMQIVGPGSSTVTVSGTDGKGGASRVFDITTDSAVVTISGLTITSGNAQVGYTSISTPGNQGGDIFNDGTLTLKDDVVTNGFSSGSVSPTARGGAIFNASGKGNTVLVLDNTIVENSLALGPSGGNGPDAWFRAFNGGPGGAAKGGGIYNDATATLIIQNGSQILNNTARGGNGGNGGKGLDGPFTGAPGGIGGNGGKAGFAQGGGIYNAGGSLQITGTSLNSIVLADNVAQGGKGGLGGNGGLGKDGPAGGAGGIGGNGGSGGLAQGGGVYNTGTFTLQFVSFQGDQAIGGAANNGGLGNNAGNGTKGPGGLGGGGGNGAAGGNAQGGGIFTGKTALTVSNVQFGLDANGVGEQALGGAGGNGGSAGNGGNSAGGVNGVGDKGATGGAGGKGGNAGFANGGAVANSLGGGGVAFTNTFFISSLAQGGKGGNAGNGGKGGVGAKANEGGSPPWGPGIGGSGGVGGSAGAAGAAIGGGVFNAVGSLSIGNSTFLSNQAIAGDGGAAGGGGVGGTGGSGSSKATGATGGKGGDGGAGGAGGVAQGGGFYNLVGAVTVTNSSFQAKNAGGIGNEAISGSGGAAGNGGVGGQGGNNGSNKGIVFAGSGGNGGLGGANANAGMAEGGAGGNQGGNTTLTGDIFTSSLVKMGTGGAGGNGGKGGDGGNSTNGGLGADGIGGNGGDASDGGSSGTYGTSSANNGAPVQGLGGAVVVLASNLTVSNSTFGGPNAGLGNQVIGGAGGVGGIGGGWGQLGHGNNSYAWTISPPFIPLAGNGGHGGKGASVYGGSLAVSGTAQTVQINNTTFTSSSIVSGNGGNGGQAGLFSADGKYHGLNGIGGDAGVAQGGAVSLSVSAAQSATLNTVTVASSNATGGSGGAGALNDLNTTPFLISNFNGFGSQGGNGGSVLGIGLAAINYSLTALNSSFDAGVGLAGMGGTGGTSSLNEPLSWQGGAGGNGGSVLGGGVFFSNNIASTLSFTFNTGSTSNNKLSAGVGGNGGFAGASGSKNVAGGAGGNGGAVQGGGIYILAGSNSVNTGALSQLLLDGNVLLGGTGGIGGAGFNAPGGNGGAAEGGGVFNSSLNTSANSSLSLSGSTLAGNQVIGGIGGNAGSGTTPNGGAGGAGGNGGNAFGGALFNGDNSPLMVVNSTFGGGSTSGTANANANRVIGNRGGRGGDAGTPAGVAKNDGGTGGAGGNVEGGNIYIASNSAAFINDTIVYGLATNPGISGAGGSGAGSGGKNGAPGANGVGIGGGYFAKAGSTDTVGNTIIAQNNAATASTADVSGTFSSQGNNILGSNASANGFTQTGDQLSITPAQLNLGPLLNNGGPTLTDALLNNGSGKSVAINAGGNTLVTSTSNSWFSLFGPNPTDQRGPGYSRMDAASNIVDVGAFELSPPVITDLNPPSAVEQSGSFILTISGNGFIAGSTVSFNGTTLIPTTISPTQITVTVPGPMPDEGASPLDVSVSIPDGSGIAGETLSSNVMPFTITEGTTLTLSNPGEQDNNEGDVVTTGTVIITSSDPDTTFSATGLPTGLSIDPNTGDITGTIDARAAGDYTVVVSGTDDGVVQGTVTFTWNVADTTPPVLTAPPNQNNNEGDTITPITVAAVDADAGTFTDVVNGKHTLPTGLSIDPNTGVISGTIGSRAEGTYTVTITASDDGFQSTPVTFTWNVADTTPPTLTNPGDQTDNEGDTVTLAIKATDADTFSATGLPTGLSIDSNTGIISGTIDPRAAGTYTVNVSAADNGYPSNPVTFTWTVKDTTPPAITNPGTENNNEGDKVNLQIQAQDAETGTFTDVVNGKHTLPTGLTIGANGLISGTIDPRGAGTYTVTISASDGSVVGSTQFTWNVADTTPPVLTSPGDQTNNEGDKVNGLSIPAVDADNFSATGLPTGLSINTTTGVISGTIDPYGAGTYTVTVTATDNGFQSNQISFTWTVNDTTLPAITSPGNQTSNEGDNITALAIKATDAETFSATGLPTGLSINAATGVISGTIDPRSAGVYQVTVTAFDGTLSTKTNFTWTVNDTTPPTLANPGSQNNNEGDKINLQIQVQDADASSITDVVSGKHTLPTGLSINSTTGLITGTIDPRAAGTYLVKLSATDGSVVGSTQFTWNVADTTPPAMINPGNQTSNEGDTVNLSISATDADSYSATGLPTGLSIDPKTGIISGTIDARAATNLNGPSQVTVFAYDNGNASSVSFTWSVADTTPPTFTSPGGQVNNEGDTVNLATSPVDADPGTIMAIGLPKGLSIDSTTGVISGTIDPRGAGAYAVSISASDDGHAGGIAFIWKVNDSTPPTVINPGGQSSSDGKPVSLAITAIDADPGTFTATGLPAGLSINPNTGVISGTLFAPPGTYNVTVSASDGSAVSSITFPWQVHSLTTSTVVTSVHNTYLGFVQVETVTAEVTDPDGFLVTQGFVTFNVNGQSVSAPVVNGFATATIMTNMFDLNLNILLNDLFAHSLSAVYSDPSGIFGSAGSSVSEPGMLLDFLLFLESGTFGSLAQQLSDVQQSP